MPQIAGFRGIVATSLAGDVSARLGSGELARDPGRALYRYHQIFKHPVDGRTLTRKAMIAAVRLVPWSEGSVRRHEETVAAARDAAAKQLATTGVEVEPIFAGYRDAAGEVDRLFKKLEGERPTLDAERDGITHRLWRLTNAEVFGAMRHVFAPKKVIVLDGNERYEAGLAHAESLGSLAMYSAANYTMMCLVNLEDPALVAVGRHKVVRGVDRSAVLEAAKAYFIVDRLATRDPGELERALGETIGHQPAFVAAFAGDDGAWKLTLSPDIALTRQGVAVDRALQRLDPVVIDAMFFGRVAKDARVSSATTATAALAALGGGADLALIVRPVGVDQILHVTDRGQLLPAGSTAFAPGVLPLVANVIDRDEDLV